MVVQRDARRNLLEEVNLTWICLDFSLYLVSVAYKICVPHAKSLLQAGCQAIFSQQ